MHDGAIVFNTKIDNSNVEKDLKATEKKIRNAQESIYKNENAKLPLVKQAEQLGAKLNEAKQRLEYIRAEMASVQKATAPGANPADYIAASADYERVKAALDSQEKEVRDLQGQWATVNRKVEEYDLKIQRSREEIERSTAEAGRLKSKLGKGGNSLSGAFDKAEKSANKLGKRLLNIGMSAFVFNVLSAGLRSAAQYMGKMLQTNKQYTQQLATLKGALLTAFQPIYEFILPGLNLVLKVLAAIVTVFGRFIAGITGKDYNQMAKNSQSLYNQANAIDAVGSAAEKAAKSLAGFDEINKLEDTGTGSGGGGGGVDTIQPDFNAFDTAAYKAKIDELTVYLSGALLALGAILAFSGTNIPLGLALMAVGALGLAAVVKENWNAMPDDLKGALGAVAAILGGAALGLGAILAFSGVNVPLGLALMASGAMALEAATKLDWNNIQNTLKGPVGEVVAIASGAALAIGAVLAFSGVNVPLGIGLIAVGAAGLVTATAVNWNSIQQALQGPIGGLVASLSTLPLAFGAILLFSGVNIPLGLALVAAGLAGTVAATSANWNFIKDKMTDLGNWLQNWILDLVNYLNITFENGFINGLATMIGDAITALWNLFVEFVNGIIENWNSIWGGISSYQTTGSIPSATGYSVAAYTPIQDIPALAKGAVLPANKPFLAMVGDQRNGTNVEAPLETIKQAVAEVIGQRGCTDELLQELIDTVRGIEVGDEIIGRAAARYNRRTSRARGL